MNHEIKYIGYMSDSPSVLRRWEIDGAKLILKLPKSAIKTLNETLLKLEYNLQNDLSLHDITKELGGIASLLEVLHKVYLEQFLGYTVRYIKNGLEQDNEVTLETLVCERLENNKQPLVLLSKPKVIPLRDAMITVLTDGRIKDIDIRECLSEGRSLNLIGDVIGVNNLIRVLFEQYHDKIDAYIQLVYKQESKKRELMSYNVFSSKYLSMPTSESVRDYALKIKELANAEYLKCGQYLIDTNTEGLYMNEDVWNIYTKTATLSISRTTIDFRDILSPKFKIDLKYFYRDLIEDLLRRDGSLTSYLSRYRGTVKAVNFAYRFREKECFGELSNMDAMAMYNFLKDTVTDDETGLPLQPTTVAKIVTNLRAITDFLIDKQYQNHTMPTINYFMNIQIKNLDNMSTTVDVIPDFVMEQIISHKSELSETYQTMFDIFNNTGMRLKEVILLEENCVDRTDDKGILLTFTPYKVILERRKANKDEYHHVYISKEIADIIDCQTERTKNIRGKDNIPYIFYNKVNGNYRVEGKGFTAAMNRIIQKYGICDLDGVVWEFDSRQMRATVAATMITNNATETEVMQQLNHDSMHTTRKHYEKVEKLKLADYNQEFFEKEFEVKVGKENLALYTEEERRALYTDFKLSYREVEFGKCIKHKSEGPCGKRSGKMSCANCSKLCTGKKYIDKWMSSLNNQKQIIEELESCYKKEGIAPEDYCNFIEYKKEIHQLKIYESVIASINEKG